MSERVKVYSPAVRVDVHKATRSTRTRMQQTPARSRRCGSQQVTFRLTCVVGAVLIIRIDDLCEMVVDVFSAERAQFMNFDGNPFTRETPYVQLLLLRLARQG